MERTKIKIFALALAISAVGYWSCQKENAPITTTTVTTDSQQREITQANNSEEIKAKIEAFERTLNSLKNGENTDVSMSTDETVWNIEALLNKTYGWANVKYTDSDSKTLKIPIESVDKLDGVNILSLYEKSLSHLREHSQILDRVDFKQLILVDIDTEKTKDGLFFTVRSVFATSQTPLNATDRSMNDIRAIQFSPVCPNAIDGKLKLRNEINFNYGLKGVDYQAMHSIELKIYYSSEADFTLPGIDNTQRRKALTYYSRTHDLITLQPVAGSFTCYPLADHNWYYTNWVNIIYSPSWKPANKVFGRIDIYDGTTIISNGPHGIGSVYRHNGYITYGIGTYQNNPPLGL